MNTTVNSCCRNKIRQVLTAFCSGQCIQTLGAIVALTILLGPLTAWTQTPVTVGYRDFNYGSTVVSTPTAEKPESKLWWNDGYWWGCLWNPTANKYRIHRFDVATQSWSNVGPDIDDRSQTLADALWDGQKLYIVSHVYNSGGSQSSSNTSAANSARLYRYSYDAATDTYTFDAGFPVLVNSATSETLVLEKDSTGQLWVTWTQANKVYMNRSLSNDLTWGTPFVLPTLGSNLGGDDISTMIAFDGKIGVVWSNQSDQKDYFAIHLDSKADTDWEPREVVLEDASLGAVADDHLNLKMTNDSGGDLYLVAKTSLSNSEPGMYLLKRSFGGGWTRYLLATHSDGLTRPNVLIDEENRELYFFANAGGGIYKKKTSLSNINFTTGVGDAFIKSSSDKDINNPTTTKQNVNSTTGLIVLASDAGSHNYMHNFVALTNSGPPTLSSFSPMSGPASTQVTINGNNLIGVTGVAFNGTAASFTVNSSTQINAVVPADATTGKISVTKASHTTVSANDFIIASVTQFALAVNTVGSGSTALNPSGGAYDAGTLVTLTATPDAGYQFAGWSGDLSGSANPATITMDANKNVTATFTGADLSGQVVHQETVTGSSSSSITVTTSANLTAMNGQLYLAAIAMDANVAVSSVSGLGLNWVPVKVQCSGKNKTAIEVWMAQGAPSPVQQDVVTATFVSNTSNAVIAVSRYANADAVNPIGNIVSGNTVGESGVCTGGADNSAYSFNLATTVNKAMAYSAVAIRDRSHTPGAGYAERADLKQSKAGVAVEDQNVSSPSTVTLNGTLSGSADWAFVGLEIKPSSGNVVQYTLISNVVGSGSITPAGGSYDAGATVTLTATPAAGYQFAGWSGDLSSAGGTNPATLTMDANKNVTATFTQIPITQYALTMNTVGSGSVALNPTGGIYDENTVVTLTASPAAGFRFTGWSGDLSGANNPATLTMNGNKTVSATFAPQFTLTTNTVGSGSVVPNPAGGIYDQSTVVALTATPATGFEFSGWSGALSGTANPATITMDANKTVTATFIAAPVDIAYAESRIGGASNSTTVTTLGSLTGVNGHLYLAAISTQPKASVLSVSGLGLNWTLVRAKCAGRNTTAIEVWVAQGTPSGNGVVTATFASTPITSTIAVSRYAGVAASNPIGNVLAGNTNGVNSAGACSGGVDNNAYSFNLATTLNGAVVYGATAMKARTHTAGAGYTERTELQQVSGTNISGLAVEDKSATTATTTVNGSFDGVVDWAVVALEIKPPATTTQLALTVHTVGSGSVTLNPTGGVYNSGAVVTLTPVPATGYQFSGWSGDLSGAANPATITMNANKNVTATFTQIPPTQYSLTVNTVGSGSVGLNPVGGVYNSGTPVTLTATPSSGYQFSGWSGNLSGTTNPATITMNANKNVTATFTAIGGSGQIAYVETVTGGSNSSTTVTTLGSLTGVSGHLYLAAISTQPKASVLSVSGLGLNWTLVRAKCAGRNTTAIEVWMAQGTPSGNGVVTATFASTPITSTIAVSRYAGVAASNPIGNVLAGNTNGINSAGACSGGVDNNAYSFNLATTLNGAVVYGATAMKARTHTAGAGYTERTELQQVSGTNTSGLAVEDKSATTATTTVNGSFDGVVDWAVVALEIKPPATTTELALTVHTVGSGSVTLNPTGGAYNSGTVVTLTPVPAAGYQFSGWSGDLSGAANPATITMNANKNVTATFTTISGSGQVVHEETVTGGSSASTSVSTATSLTGAAGHLYLAAISARSNVPATNVSGLGLTWTRVLTQCSGRNITGVDVWMAQGTPTGSGVVTATLAQVPNAAVIIVSRYSGVDAMNPIGSLVSGNTAGGIGVCSGGVDNAAYAFNFTTSVNGGMVYGAIAVRNKTNTPGAGYTERGELMQAGSSSAALAVQDKIFTTAGAVTFNGTTSSAVDWAVIALEIKPQLSLSKFQTNVAKVNLQPTEFALESNYPNPFNPSTAISFTLPMAANVSLDVYDVTGHLIRVLASGEMAAGRYAEHWNGHDNFNRSVAAGVYLYQIVAESEDGKLLYTQTRRMTLLK